MHQRYISLFWLVFVSTLRDLQLQSSASGWKYGFSVSLWFCHKSNSRKSERVMGRRAVHPPPNVFPFVLQDREQARRWGVEREEERDVWKRGGEVERIDSVCWTQIKVCLVCRPHKTTCTHTHPKHSPRKTHRDSQTRDTRKTNSPCL